jgi:hypothetical protein
MIKGAVILESAKMVPHYGLVYNRLQQVTKYFSYIMATSFSGEEAGVPRENHRPWASNW